MPFFWNNDFLRPLTFFGVWLFGNNENEVLTLDNKGERHVDAYGSEGSPFARLVPDLHGGDDTAGLEEDIVRRIHRQRQHGHTSQRLRSKASPSSSDGCGGPCVECVDDEVDTTTTAYLSLVTLRLILEYRLECAPLPLAVAAAGPRLRLAGELTSVFYFPGAASCVRAAASVSAVPAAAVSSLSAAPPMQGCGSPPLLHQYLSGSAAPWWLEVGTPHARRLRGTSLQSLTSAMRHAAWWYGWASPDALALMTEDDDYEEKVEQRDAADTWRRRSAPASRQQACLPLCVEVVVPRGAVAAAVVPTRTSSSSSVSAASRLAGWVWQSLATVLHREKAAGPHGVFLPPLDAELRNTVAQFVALIDQLWCLYRCALVELAMERYPIALTEWLLSPDVHPPFLKDAVLSSLSTAGVAEASKSADVGRSSLERFGGAGLMARAHRAFRHVHTLKCRGRVGQASAEAISAATAVARGVAPAPIPSAFAVGAARTLSFSLSFTAVRPFLRVLDLSGTPVTSLEGVETFPLLERVAVTGCGQLSSLSPLGLAPSLREIIASQSGIYDLEGVAQSRTLVSLSLYGCLNLTDVSACGRVPTLRDLFISESTVEVVEGLQRSRSLVRLGMRYCDVPLLTALSSVASLRVLHASSSTLSSVAALQYCASLEVVEVAACAQLLDLGPLGLAPSLREIDAAGSGVRHVAGLRLSATLEKLHLAQCIHLEEMGQLRHCARLRQLSLTGTLVRSLDGLAGAPALVWLDVSFCRQLASFSVLLQLPELREVRVDGCTAALRHPEDVQSIVKDLGVRRKRVMVLQS